VHWADETAARERFAEPIHSVQELMPEAEIALLSPAEIAFRCQFARARLSHLPGSFRVAPEVVFGVGAQERVLEEKNAAVFRQGVHSVGEVRHFEGPRDHVLWRMHPESWLESLVTQDVTAVDERLDADCLYSQVPAFSASDRAMIDVLTVTRDGRLAVVELKADEDIHLPLQRLGLLVAGGLASCAGRVPALWIFSGKRVVERVATPVPGSAGAARPPRNRHPAALHFTRNQLGRRGRGRKVEEWSQGGVPQAAESGFIAEKQRENQIPESQLILICSARPQADVANPPVEPGDMRCGRPTTRPHAGWSGRLPREYARTSQFSDS
jgi:hypothetical protein